MPIHPQEAATALREITATEQQSHKAYHYQQASPHLILWGVIWVIGYAVT